MTDPLLEAHSLSVGYRGGPALLVDWEAAFWPGEVVAITAPSGRGKSSLLYALGLMLRPRSGSVTVDGYNTTGLNDAALAHFRAHQFGFVFQDAALDASRSVLDNVLESGLYRGGSSRAERARARLLLSQLGVETRSDACPGQVSGGQAQRIALCRALLGDPPVLLADEPTGNLDAGSARMVLDAFHEHAASGATVVVVTHDDQVVRAATRRIAL